MKRPWYFSILLSILLAFSLPSFALPSQSLFQGTLIGADETVVIDALGQGTVGVQITGTWVGTLAFEGTIDNTNWFALNAAPIPSGATVTTTTANGQWVVLTGGVRNVRVRASAYTSGTVTVWLASSLARAPGVMPSYLNFPSGSVLNFGGGDVTVTHSTDTLTVTGGALVLATTPLAVGSGGTGVTTLALNGILYGNAANAVGVTAIGSPGQILRVGASPFVPAWTTATYPATTTAYKLLTSTSTSVIGELAAVGATGEYLAGVTGGIPAWATLNQAAVAGLTTASNPTFAGLGATPIISSYAGPHAIGGAAFGDYQVYLRGAFSGATNAEIIHINTNLTVPAGGYAAGIYLAPTFTKAGSGTHANFTGLLLDAPTIVAGGAALTNASTVKITGAPTAATNNYSLWIAAGAVQLGDVTLTPSTSILTLAGGTTGYIFNDGPLDYLTHVYSQAGAGAIATGTVRNSFYRITAAGTVTLPAGTVVGQTVSVVSTTAAAVSLDPASTSDYLILNGTALAAGNKATSDGTIGAMLSCVNEVANYWRCQAVQGVFSDGGA